MNIFTLGYFGLTAFTIAFTKLTDPNLLFFCTGGITVMNLIYTYYMRKLNQTQVNRIEWDVATESFIIVRPKGLFKELEDRLAPNELVMNAESKDRDCIYFDALTGQGIATVNRG